MSEETLLPVYLRLRPKPAQCDSSPFLTCVTNSNTQVTAEPPKNNRYKTEETFSFTGVFRGGSTQLDIYKTTMFPLVEHVLKNARDSLFFTMGPSGAGKSHTTLGYKQTPGMIHLAVDTIFKSIGPNIAEFEDVEEISDKNPNRQSSAVEAGLFLDWSKTGTKQKFSANSMFKDKVEINDRCTYAVYVSMVEIYNERIYNLLDHTSKRSLIIKKDASNGKVQLADTQKVYVSEREEAFKVIDQGLAKRQANATGLNQVSSRSHAFTIIEVKRISGGRRKEVTSSTLTVVDLAGSERNKISKTAGKELTESCAINRSLMQLGQCLQKQRDREKATTKGDVNKEFSIFRNSKLTQLLLSNVFVPKLKQKSLIMVNVDPYGDYNSASQMLRYSALARDIVVPQSRISSLSQISAVSDEESSTTTLAELDGRIFSDSSIVSVSEDNVKELVQRIHQLELEVVDANRRCLAIEQEVREEMSNQMDEMVNSMQVQYLDQLDDDYDRNQDMIDNKVELTNSLHASELEAVRRELEQVKAENKRLRLGRESILQERGENLIV